MGAGQGAAQGPLHVPGYAGIWSDLENRGLSWSQHHRSSQVVPLLWSLPIQLYDYP